MDYYEEPGPAPCDPGSVWALAEAAEENWQYPVVGVAGALVLHSGRASGGTSYVRACRLLDVPGLQI
ncbi:hypothetical protein [Streptomyces sp. 3N207]|uniref:hypothetical protein n=1 Tax=Streptomyces sp. 3N207 TaxID=3457417 RepID=UPI003FD3B279